VIVRVVVGVCVAWILIAVLWGAQATMGAAIRGGDPLTFSAAVRAAFGQTLPWIPMTFGAIALGVRVPITRRRWILPAALHLGNAAALAIIANMLVVLGFWIGAGRFDSVPALVKQGVIWATINSHIALVLYLAILGVTQGALYYRRTRSRELELAQLEGQLARARLEALTAQIRPHFLFNTLHTIGQLWRSGRADDADAVLDHLGSLFHKVQRSTSRFEVPLAEELELVREYLAIEEARFRDRLRTTVRAPSSTLDCLVPPLILQPLVENAVRHGVSAVSTAGVVEVSAALTDGHLRLTVRDDGPGMAAKTAQPGSGTGLRNTRERLARLYGSGEHLRIADAPGGGTIVTIDVPLDRSPNGNGAHG
jgi:two-component system, LytTR family, sensor kinase